MTAVHLGILLASLLGFAGLALATERYAEHLLGKMPAPRWRHLARAAGWVLLAVALALGIRYLGTGVGISLWLGWLSIAALALVFYLPKWPWQPPQRARPGRKPKAAEGEEIEGARLPRRRSWRWWPAALMVAVPLVYLAALQATPVKPLLRADAVEGQVGPWTFRLAESDRKAPTLVAMEIPMKSYHVRFCEVCDGQIRAAYLKVNKPRSLRGAGIVLGGSRWDRQVEIQLPANTTPESGLWLTVVGKDGEMHQAEVRLADVSPATMAWFEQWERQ